MNVGKKNAIFTFFFLEKKDKEEEEIDDWKNQEYKVNNQIVTTDEHWNENSNRI